MYESYVIAIDAENENVVFDRVTTETAYATRAYNKDEPIWNFYLDDFALRFYDVEEAEKWWEAHKERMIELTRCYCCSTFKLDTIRIQSLLPTDVKNLQF